MYQDVGQSGLAVNLARQVAAADPLSPIAFNSYFTALLYAGRTEAAKRALADAEKAWPDSTSVSDARYRLYLRYGDPAEALRMQDQGIVQGGPIRDAYLKARLDPAQIDHAVAIAMSAYNQYGPDSLGEILQILGEFNRNDQLFDLLMRPFDEGLIPQFVDVLFRPGLRGFRKDPRFIQVAKQFGLTSFWINTGQWPDFCLEPDLPYDCKTEAAKLN
jgi:tetratricopeptide (TPR) repeat protein